ncbi:hypothetical protein [Alkalicoccus daliensis]|uniref:DUF3953 domain-containing protein n=1 Tax=Alkalicoccus daliensis TaxID=745820 RepID=A0A1H0CK42_9BACI|nr:hypothetical protein [Alkalicoccus daliensis]SDN58236.1 hypothetical protein SAMN04488053_102132 [Alkalicoccus daliensis]
MFEILIIIISFLVIFTGFYSINNEPNTISAVSLGIFQSLLFAVIGRREWMRNHRIAGVILFAGTLFIVLQMIRYNVALS